MNKILKLLESFVKNDKFQNFSRFKIFTKCLNYRYVIEMRVRKLGQIRVTMVVWDQLK